MKWINGVGDELILPFYILSSPVLCPQSLFYAAGSSMPTVLNYYTKPILTDSKMRANTTSTELRIINPQHGRHSYSPKVTGLALEG